MQDYQSGTVIADCVDIAWLYLTTYINETVLMVYLYSMYLESLNHADKALSLDNRILSLYNYAILTNKKSFTVKELDYIVRNYYAD